MALCLHSILHAFISIFSDSVIIDHLLPTLLQLILILRISMSSPLWQVTNQRSVFSHMTNNWPIRALLSGDWTLRVPDKMIHSGRNQSETMLLLPAQINILSQTHTKTKHDVVKTRWNFEGNACYLNKCCETKRNLQNTAKQKKLKCWQTKLRMPSKENIKKSWYSSWEICCKTLWRLKMLWFLCLYILSEWIPILVYNIKQFIIY